MRTVRGMLLAFICAVALGGCVVVHGPAASADDETIIMLTQEHRLLAHVVYGEGAECVLVIGGMHGDEPAGPELAWALVAYLDAHSEAYSEMKIVVAPAINPDGLTYWRRGNAAGEDINRGFPALPDALVKSTQRENEFVMMLIEKFRPSRIVQLHQPLACVDWDGPAEEIAKKVAEACGLPLKKLGARRGSLGRYAGVDRGIPVINIELPEEASQAGRLDLWESYGNGLLSAIAPNKSTP